MSSTERIPAGACYLDVPGDASLQCGDNGEGARSAPVEMLARTGSVIEHWYWGPMVHDLDGMRVPRGRVLIDWRHDREYQLGYLNKFETQTGDLIARGALVPYGDDDRAAEIAHKSREGVPYQASIEFGGSMLIEEVAAGQSVTVNGQELQGPLTVFREWELEAVAICPFGADPGTDCTALDGDAARNVSIRKVSSMAANNQDKQQLEQTQPTEAPEAVEVDNGTLEQEAGGNPAAVETGSANNQLSEPQQRRQLAQQFAQQFGEQRGGQYFLEGLTLEEASARFVDDLRAENAELQEQLQAVSDSEPAPLSQAPAPDTLEQPKTFSKRIRISGKRYAE